MSGENTLCCGCAGKLIRPVSGLFNLGRAVHPLEPSAPENGEFLSVGPKSRVRVIHARPGAQVGNLSGVAKRLSLSEEYWFTRWNKPLKTNICNCSFRRSMRSEEEVRRISDVETFVERLVEETSFEAYKECAMRRSEEEGVRNEGFKCSEDDQADSIREEKENAAVLAADCVTVNEKENNQSTVQSNVNLRRCEHKESANNIKKPLVFLFHGIGCSADFWWPIIKSLTNRGYETVAPDMLGHGFSSAPDKPSAYTFRNLLKHATLVFDSYTGGDQSRRCILIGHSFGCSLATALYKFRAQQIMQLVLISGGGPTPLAPPATDDESVFSDFLRFAIKPLLLCGVKRSLFYSSRGKHLGPCDTNTAVPKNVLRYIEKGQHWPEGDAAFHRRILVPTLLVHGLQDKKITLVQECEMERTIPRAFLELIPNAGHMSMLEAPEHLAHMILCFVEWWSH